MNRRVLVVGVGALVVGVILVILFATGVFFSGNSSANEAEKDQDATATAEATSVPAATATSVVVTGSGTAQCVDHEMKANETFQVPAGCRIKGDVEVNGQKLYDDDPATGLIVSCPSGCTVEAPFGANVTGRSVDDLKAEMLSSGCGSKCASVNVVVIDQGKAPAPSSAGPAVTCDPSIPKGSTMLVPGGCVVSGDVEVNGKALYDSDQSTGLVVVVTAEVTVHAPFGASVTNANPDDVVNAVKQTGCGLPSGCATVKVVTVP